MSGSSDVESPAVHNRDVERALKEYCSFPHSQGFAVMLNGRWGSGKTHFINSILSDLVPPGKDPKNYKPLYVSLYGVKDPSGQNLT
jgi:DNA replication protein DnaC